MVDFLGVGLWGRYCLGARAVPCCGASILGVQSTRVWRGRTVSSVHFPGMYSRFLAAALSEAIFIIYLCHLFFCLRTLFDCCDA
ncbi:hypothetical protein D3C85_1231560 [compost metagenome]